MTTRVHIILSGGPPEEGVTHSFVGIADARNKSLLLQQSDLVRWRPVNKKEGLWAIEVDTVPFTRPPVVCVVGDAGSLEEMSDICDDMARHNVIVLRPEPPHLTDNLDVTRLLAQLHLKKVDVADRIFVVNPGGKISAEAEKAIKRATDAGKDVGYLAYL